jgi:hypothetical protein
MNNFPALNPLPSTQVPQPPRLLLPSCYRPFANPRFVEGAFIDIVKRAFVNLTQAHTFLAPDFRAWQNPTVADNQKKKEQFMQAHSLVEGSAARLQVVFQGQANLTAAIQLNKNTFEQDAIQIIVANEDRRNTNQNGVNLLKAIELRECHGANEVLKSGRWMVNTLDATFQMYQESLKNLSGTTNNPLFERASIYS